MTTHTTTSSVTPQGLSITEAEFNEYYPDLVGSYDFFNSPPPAGISKKHFEDVYLKSKLWRLNNIYTVINKDGDPVIFRMNKSQHKVYAKSRQHPRVIILKSRQQGISTLWLVSYFDDATFCPFMNLGLMAQGADEAATLLERTKFLWDMLSPSIKNFLRVSVVKDNAKAFEFSNKSTIFIRTSFRSATLQRLHISEFGKIANNFPKRAKETKTGTLQALGRGNTGVIESTAEGRNEFKFMWDKAVVCESSGQMSHKDFAPVFLSWLDDPDCTSEVNQTIDASAAEYFAEVEEKMSVHITREQKNFWIIQRRELEGDILQEYPATPDEAFSASKNGTYYSNAFAQHVVAKGKVRTNVYDPHLPVDVYFDLGVDDYFVCVVKQWYRGEQRIIDEYYNNGYAMTHYIDEIARRGYGVRSWNFPHDISVRELGSSNHYGQAKSREDIIREYMEKEGIGGMIVAMPKDSIADGIEAVRRMLPNLVIDAKCVYLIDCLNNYSKEWDDKLQVWKKTPLHDEYSHGADVLRSIASNTIESDEYNRSTHYSEPRTMGGGGGYSV